MEDPATYLEEQSLHDFELAELEAASSQLTQGSLFSGQRRDGACSTAASGASSLFSSPDRHAPSGSDFRSPLRTLTNGAEAAFDGLSPSRPLPGRKLGWSPRLDIAGADNVGRPHSSPGHFVARNPQQRPDPTPQVCHLLPANRCRLHCCSTNEAVGTDAADRFSARLCP